VKVIHFAHGFFPEGRGGVESYLRDVLRAQRAAGIDARLCAGSLEHWPELGVEEVELEGIPVLRVHRDDLYFDHFARLYHPGVEGLVRELLCRERPELVHVHQWIRLTCNLVGIAAELGIPAVVTLHDLYTSCPRCFRVRPDDENCGRPLSVGSCLDCVPRFGHESGRELRASIELYRDQYRDELETAKAVLAASTATADLIAATTGLSRALVELLPLAYEPRFGGRAAAAPPRDVAPLRFGYWGNLTERKGVPVLLRAFRAVCEAGLARPAELHLFGRVDTEALERELSELAAGIPVTFHGRFEYADLAAAGLHVAVFPMVCFETYGFVLDEAFELGLPAVVTDIGAIPSRAGEAALRVPPNDVGALARALRRLVEEPRLAAELRVRIRPVGMSTEEHVEKLRAIYERVRGLPYEPYEDRGLARRRAELLLLQRESAQARICPPGGPR
jgi:glycosyltransferase involved in cell wall biosynthesis